MTDYDRAEQSRAEALGYHLGKFIKTHRKASAWISAILAWLIIFFTLHSTAFWSTGKDAIGTLLALLVMVPLGAYIMTHSILNWTFSTTVSRAESLIFGVVTCLAKGLGKLLIGLGEVVEKGLGILALLAVLGVIGLMIYGLFSFAPWWAALIILLLVLLIFK